MKQNRKQIIIVGAGGHARMIAASIIKSKEYQLFCFLNDFKKRKNETIFGYPIKTKPQLIKEYKNYYYIIGIGDNIQRRKIFNTFKQKKLRLATVIDTTAIVSNLNTKIKKGTYIAPGAIININTTIGENSIINSGAIVEHDCLVGKNCHIAPGVRVAGYVKIGCNTFIGIGASIKDKIKIGQNVVVGAGAVVINDIKNNLTVAGTPAKTIIKSK